ncbi:elongation factor 4, partial [candidate division WWE3 bacterium CG08_land_8_20_14_0_20_41_15]
MQLVKQENIRNFCIIAHVDHGKSTLADRLLEKTGTIPPREMRAQVLDNMELEREKGVTIKLKAVRMNYDLAGQKFILNLIDTPGHVDFSYEVSRALAACEGAVLVIDATQGIQAQTIANLQKAKDQNLKIIPVINKIDLPNAIPLEIEQQVVEVFGFEKSEIIFASGKTGEGVEEIIKAIVERVPAPNGNYENPLRGLVFDSSYNEHLGVVAYVRVVDGKISENEKILFMRTGATCEPKEVGYLFPDFKKGEG